MPKQKKQKYPKSIYFIIGNEFCERFSFYGMRAILSLYLSEVLQLSKHKTLIIYHFFIFLLYLFPIFGAIVADTCLGKYWTILILSIVYAIGSALVAVAAVFNTANETANAIFLWVGLTLIAVGTGGIKPCVPAFGGDQFVLPDEEEKLIGFYSLFYFSANLGGLVSILSIPIVRRSTGCLGLPNCYPLAFALPSILMTVSIILFVAGTKQYKRKPTQGCHVLTCICYALWMKCKYGKQVEKEHWLDFAEDKYDKQLINDAKVTLRILFLYVPLPLYWCLYDQQGGEWVFQATRMNGELRHFKITPDQMQLANPLFVLIFIPVIRMVVYPILKIIGLGRPLQRIMIGGILTAISFIVAGFVAVKIEKLLPDEPTPGYAQLRVYNTLNCNATLISPALEDNEPINIKKLEMFEDMFVQVQKSIRFVRLTMRGNCGKSQKWMNRSFTLVEQKAFGCYIRDGRILRTLDDLKRDPQEKAKIRFLLNLRRENPTTTTTTTETYQLQNQNEKEDVINETTIRLTSRSSGNNLTFDVFDNEVSTVPSDFYDLEIGAFYKKENLWLKHGGIYTLLGVKVNKTWETALRTVVTPNTISILYQLPQYALISAGEVLFAITGMEFAYIQAPNHMKATIQAFWLLTNAIGNIVIVGIESLGFFKRQSANFFVYSMFMMSNLICFGMLASRYQYVDFDIEEIQ